MPKFSKDKHVIKLQKKEFILFPGLLAEASDTGLFVGVDRKTIQEPNEENNRRAIVEATVKFLVVGPDGGIVRDGEGNPIVATYTAQGDASPADLARNMVPALLRMAETRAVARALRFATASEYTAYDELPPEAQDQGTIKQDTRPS